MCCELKCATRLPIHCCETRALFRGPSRFPFPDKRFIVIVRLFRIARAVTLLQRAYLQSLKVFPEGFANQSGPIPLRSPRGLLSRSQQVWVENDLDRFHMWTLLHSRQDERGAGGLVRRRGVCKYYVVRLVMPLPPEIAPCAAASLAIGTR